MRTSTFTPEQMVPWPVNTVALSVARAQNHVRTDTRVASRSFFSPASRYALRRRAPRPGLIVATGCCHATTGTTKGDTVMHDVRERLITAGILVVIVALGALALPRNATAARSSDCEGGGWVLTAAGNTVRAQGRHVQFDIDLQTMAVRNWTLTGAPNSGRLVDHPTIIYAAKSPDHRGAVLIETLQLRNDAGDLVFIRGGNGVEVKIQAKDCSQGGVFQMEVDRDDGTPTRITHVLADGIFYFDNPNFRDREGDVVPFSNSAGATQNITITPRINLANDASALLVARDSPQAATRVLPPAGVCVNQIPRRDGTFATVRHCGAVSQWDVLPGGRMGQVMGEDSTEVAPPATFCVKDCQARNQVRGGAVVLGHPFPVADAFRLKPLFP